MLAVVRKHYDKLVALIVLLVLLGSAVYLVVRVGMIRHMQDRFTREITAMQPTHEHAPLVDSGPLEAARSAIRQPFQLAHTAWTNRMLFVPERRVWCVDCRRPIPYDSMDCVFCGADQPPPRERDPTWDTDKDGIPDLTEDKLGLNRLDPNDINKDADADGYANKVEYDAGTDLNDPDSFPPPEHDLRLVKIDAIPFDLLFKSVIKLPDGKHKFALNVRRGDQRTFFVKLGENVGGFTVSAYEPKTEMRTRPGVATPVSVDVSELTLTRGPATIVLRKGKNVEYSEYQVLMHFAHDAHDIEVALGQTFTLKGRAFEVISVDTTSENVVIRRTQDKKEIVVRKRTAPE
jgi:hypothetical protein